MKKQSIFSLGLLCLLAFALLNCDKKKEDPTPGTGTTTPPTTVSTAPALDNAASATTSSDITADAAKVSSTISGNGGAAITQYGHVWSDTKTEPTTADAKTELGKTDGPFPLKFSSDLKSLKANTTYNVRAYATNDKGTTYGTAAQVKTGAAGTPTVSLADWKTARALGEGFDNTRTEDLIADGSGNFYITGSYNKAGKIGKFSTGSGNGGFVAKLDGTGEPLWVIELTSTSSNSVYDLDMDAAGNLYAALSAGTRNATFGSFTLPNFGGYTAKITPDGKVEWVRSFGIRSGSAGSLGGYHVDAQGNCYVIERILGNNKARIGTTTVTGSDPAWVINNGSEGWDQVIARFDPTGKLLWTRQFSGAGQQSIDFDVDPNGSVYVALQSPDGVPAVGGTALASAGEFLLKLSSSGSLEWSKIINTPRSTFVNVGISCTTSGEFLVQSIIKPGISIGGVTTTSTTPSVLATFRQDGSTKWATTTPGLYTGTAVDNLGNVYVTSHGNQNSPFSIGDITLPAQTPETQRYIVVAKYSPAQSKWLWAVRNKCLTVANSASDVSLAISSAGIPLTSASYPTGDVQFGTIKATMPSRFGVIISTIEQK